MQLVQLSSIQLGVSRFCSLQLFVTFGITTIFGWRDLTWNSFDEEEAGGAAGVPTQPALPHLIWDGPTSAHRTLPGSVEVGVFGAEFLNIRPVEFLCGRRAEGAVGVGPGQRRWPWCAHPDAGVGWAWRADPLHGPEWSRDQLQFTCKTRPITNQPLPLFIKLLFKLIFLLLF